MESSRRDLFIDMVVDKFIFKGNQRVTLPPCFTFTPKAGEGLPKTGAKFYCEFPRPIFMLINFLRSSFVTSEL